MAYANVQDFEQTFGQSFIDGFVAGVVLDEREAFIGRLLDQAAGRMNAALEKGKYPAPITEDDIRSGLAVQVLELLRFYNCFLAASPLLAGNNDLPEGAKTAIKNAEAWLLAMEEGKQRLAGVDRVTVEVREVASGNVLFVPTGEGLDLPEGFHARQRFIC